MELAETVNSVRDAFTIKRVYGEPIERDGVTVIPAALIVGGGGGGGGGDTTGNEGGGSGFVGFSRPVGAYVIRDGQVRWEPAIDVTWLLLGVPKLILKLFMARRRRQKHRKGH